jgi:hypothetical protein
MSRSSGAEWLMSPHIKGNLLSEDQNLTFRKTGRNYMNMSCGNLLSASSSRYSIGSGMSDYLNMVRKAADLRPGKGKTRAQDGSIQWERGRTNGGIMRCI